MIQSFIPDIVIPLGLGSLHQDLELRYCLRSIEKYVYGFRNIVIVGEKPDWVQNIIHLPLQERGSNPPERIYRKIWYAAKTEFVSDQFLYCNDDFFFLKNLNAAAVPNYHQFALGLMAERCRQKRGYYEALLNTQQVLLQNGLPRGHYDVHAPVIFRKRNFLRLNNYDWSVPNGYVIKSLYCNSFDGQTPYNDFIDLKINHPLESEEELQELIKDRWIFSIGDNALTNDILLNWLEKNYPTPSKYEI